MHVYAIALMLLAASAVLIVAGVARRNRPGERLCPKCRFNLAGTKEARCPECGYAWRDEQELAERPPRRFLQALGLVLLIAAFGTAITGFVVPKHWTDLVPRFAMAMILDVVVATPAVPPGKALPAPDANLASSKDRWERLVWQEQTSRAFEAFLAMGEAADGSITSIEALVPAAQQVEILVTKRGGTFWEDAWPSRASLEAIRAQRGAIDATFAANGGPPIGTFLASEVQFLSGDASARPRWIEPPFEIHAALAQSADPNVRAHAVSRLGHIDHPEIEAILERLVADPDPDVALLARQILDWRIALWPSIKAQAEANRGAAQAAPAP